MWRAEWDRLNWSVAISIARSVRAGFFPLDQQLELTDPHWSDAVCKLAVWLSGLVSFKRADEILAKVGGIYISSSSIWKRSQQWGQRFVRVEQREQSQAEEVELQAGIVPGEVLGAERLGVSLDGFMILLRKEGWKEVKAGCVFRVDQETVLDPATQEEQAVGRARQLSYTAYLGGPEGLGQKVWAEAKRRRWSSAMDTQAIGDGAVWIWNLVAEYFYDSVQVVDWSHAKSHLAHVAQLLHGEGTPAMQRWLKEQETSLFQGQAEDLALLIRRVAESRPLVKADLLTEAGYFETHKRRMEYLDRRMEGWVIGSGMMESGAKQYQARFKGPGMQWGREGAERLLPVRTAILSERFDMAWQTAHNLPPE
jgi:hypothetical protein